MGEGGNLPITIVTHGTQVQKECREPSNVPFLDLGADPVDVFNCENSSSPHVDDLALCFLYVLLSPSKITLKNGKFNYDNSVISNLT